VSIIEKVFAVAMTLLVYQLIFLLATEGAHTFRQQHKIIIPRCSPSKDIVVASRFWARTEADLQKLNDFLKITQEVVGDRLCAFLLAINVKNDLRATSAHLEDMGQTFPRLETIEIDPWSITTPLNAMLSRASALGTPYILFASVEVHIDRPHFDALIAEMEGDTLVSGVALPGHEPFENIQPVRKPKACGETRESKIAGTLLPWNTLAMWDIEKLSKVGFLKDADLQDPPGMEEAVPIAMLQKLHGKEIRKAKLLHFSDEYKPAWHVSFKNDPSRRAKQARKMASKNRRTAKQLSSVGLQGTITHVYYCMHK